MSGSTSTSQDLPITLLPLTSQQRDELDRDFLKANGSFLKILNEEDATSDLLDYMLETLDLDMAQEETLQKHPQLREIIRHACQTRSFSHIADLIASEVSCILVEDRSDFIYDLFVRPYVGKAVDGFYEYLKNNNMEFRGPRGPYYAKFCSIVQSSGTGKSRLMIELRKKGVIVLYMNLREPSDLGYPVRDLVPARILTENTGCTAAEYTAHCCAFFTAIFQTLQQVLSSKLLELHSGSPDLVIKSWNNEMCDMRSKARTDFFQKVQSRYQDTLDNIKMPKLEEQTDVETAAKPGNKIRSAKSRGKSFVTTSYNNMLRVLQHLFTEEGKVSNDDPKLVIAFDEAYTLSNMSGRGFRPSDIIGRTINCYSRQSNASVWVVFVSTTLQVDFSAPQETQDSTGLIVYGGPVYLPYTCLGWDQDAFNHIVGFGRPLFVPTFLSLFPISLTTMNRWKSLAERRSVADILILAAQKLCKSITFDANDAKQALAVLSQRFDLNFCLGHPDAASHLSKAVASHLRILFSTTEDRMWSFTGYPSEPILSCVAAIILHKTPSNVDFVLGILKKKIDGGMVEIGQSGELASRLLLLLAKDLFVRKDPPNGVIRGLLYGGSGDAELIDCRKVSTFWSRTIEEAKAAFQHAYINFLHWVSMTEFISPLVPDQTEADSLSARCSAEEWTLRHWHRTSAVQRCHLQPLVDKMIPIYFDDPDLDSEDLNRNCHEHDLGLVTRTHDSIQCLSNLPYIALLLDLDVEPKLNVTFSENEPNHVEMNRSLVEFGSTARLRNLQWEAQDA
ncbi:uncharacterized protein F5891DRAFT_1061388 [Suillus fuscotomentosus]|uniref:Uncharacterized protein n=1 Tax=Suillus fuscotomentosus TaxID=1912939 RepID=A0AAD4HFK3_9AGAM|nr:uncharacterized protein F5891DRAFT_1061388 [Suillus fuscotomentosus]KAG1894748.1 hypothetical protein F5891DRAFT_1061388 [Suillus fuscotomentosus]